MPELSEAGQRIMATADKLGIKVTSEFVPWSRSRNKDEKQPTLNWLVSLWFKAGKKPFLTTDYGAGCGHCPGYKLKDNYERQTLIAWECEHGKAGRMLINVDHVFAKVPVRKIEPNAADVLHSLVSDSEVLQHADFESWATDTGYETDSRKAEAIYKACVANALAFVAAVGFEGLAELQEACRDY